VKLRAHLAAAFHTIRGRHERALAIYQNILASDPGDPAALSAVLSELRRGGEALQAIEVAERALAAMPDNFMALDGLAWARIQRGEHEQARTVVERAIVTFEALKPGKPLGALERLALGTVRLLGTMPGLRSRVPRIPSAASVDADAARGLADWRKWANDYLAWYEQKHGSGR
jgi:tetratricopeptide (TPR) repeat protein